MVNKLVRKTLTYIGMRLVSDSAETAASGKHRIAFTQKNKTLRSLQTEKEDNFYMCFVLYKIVILDCIHLHYLKIIPWCSSFTY